MTEKGVIKNVVIVGGGTAGWLTASILAADHCAAHADGLNVTLIESARVPILGVGEGTWPSLRDTLRRIGISETDFFRKCQASFKQGSRFNGWRTGQPDDFYFHPFEAPPSAETADALSLWKQAPQGVSFAEAVNHQATVCLAGLAPKQAGTPEFAAVTNYAYHLDAPAFAEFLADHATNNLGVRHIIDDVTGYKQLDQGEIESVQTEQHGAITADLFVDCSGSRALLIGDALGSPLTDVSDVLFNDRALALHVPYSDDQSVIVSQTNGTALEAGWVWDIGLQSRRGVGYVHSSRHIDEGAARDALTGYLHQHDSTLTAENARLIKFRSAYRAQPWVKNVVAVGMSSGFVEPLEASAIVMIELSATMISDTLPPHHAVMKQAAAKFNNRFSYRWSRIIDFLKLHYVLSERHEPYWRDHRDPETWTPRLRDLLEQWQYQPPSREDFTQSLEIFPAASYAYVMYGMGFKTHIASTRRRKNDGTMLRQLFDDVQAKAARYSAGLPTNRELINHIVSHGLSRV
ncbi:MAG: tryptophan halogenase family protein [Pseudomonadota bacterium]